MPQGSGPASAAGAVRLICLGAAVAEGRSHDPDLRAELERLRDNPSDGEIEAMARALALLDEQDGFAPWDFYEATGDKKYQDGKRDRARAARRSLFDNLLEEK